MGLAGGHWTESCHGNRPFIASSQQPDVPNTKRGILDGGTRTSHQGPPEQKQYSTGKEKEPPIRKPPAKGHPAFRRSGVVERLPIGDWFGQWWTRQWKCLHHTPAERQRWKRESPFCAFALLPFCAFALWALKVRRLVLQSLRCAGLPCPHLPAPRDPCRCCTGPAPFSTRRRSVQLDEVQHSGEWTAQQLAPAAISGQLRSRRIASPIALPPPSVSSTTSTATRHRQATPKYLVASAIPTAAPRHWSYPAVPSSHLIPDRRLLLGVRVRSCLAWSDAGSGQSTVDRAPSLRPKKKSERSNSQKSEPLPRCLLSTLHRDRPMLPQPSPNPSNAPVSVPRPRPRPPHHRVPQQQPSCCRLSSPVASRPSLTRVARLPHAPARTRDALPPPRLSTPERVN